MVIKKNEEPAEEWDQIEIGDQVKHAKWGVGTVLFRSGTGANAKAIVVFPEEGQKKLMLRFAKLKKVGTTTLKSVEKLKAEILPTRPTRERAVAAPEEEAIIDLEAVAGDEDLVIEDEDAEVVGFDDDEDEFGARGKDTVE